MEHTTVFNPCEKCEHGPYCNLLCSWKCEYANLMDQNEVLKKTVEQQAKTVEKQAEALGCEPITPKAGISHSIADFQRLLHNEFHELNYVSVCLGLKALRHMLKYQAPLSLEELQKIVPKPQDMEVNMPQAWLWIEVLKPEGLHNAFSQSAYYHLLCDYTNGKSLCCGYPGHVFEFDYADYGKTWQARLERPTES